MKINTSQDLRYRAVLSRGEHETWPPLVIDKARYDVTEVTVEVTVDDGEFRARPAYVQRGRRIRADGSLGHPIGGSRALHIYSGPRGGPAWEQAEMFTQAALQAARAGRVGGQVVHVLHYWHKHGDDITVYATHALAQASAAGIARMYWGELDVHGDVPESPGDLSDEEAASVYFGELEEHEGYEITETTVIGAAGEIAAGLETCQACGGIPGRGHPGR
jgi:hypothetical protein